MFDQLHERVAGLDVHKAQVTAAVRVPGRDGARVQEVAEFKTTVQGLLALRDWLCAHGITYVAMEATGVYWRPIWAILEDAFECILCNARDVKQVPGRKTDVSDCAWLAQLAEAGLLRASFVPPKPIRALRNLTRYRKTQIEERQREANRMHKILEDTGIKLDCVATDILGASGRAMLDALCAGTTDPEILAELAKGRMRSKIPALREALEGRFDAQHALIVSAILAHLDFLDEQIMLLSDAIEEQIGPFEPAVELLCTIPGVQRRTAEVIVSETGADMSVFPSAKHLASWAGQCPGNDESAGKRRSGRTRKGSRWLGIALTEAALAATRQKDTYLGAQYRRLRGRRGHKKALGAVKHSIIVAAWHMLSTGELYNDPGADYFDRRVDPQRKIKRLIAQLEGLGQRVVVEPAVA
ncbi:MAG: IS110 family transposase [Actinobacteria bacterium]|nr:IS110 family transposase [Actinomycetota bacterium]MCA1698744.1 IS110 family transposase [Actinomycetota bacterium]